MKKNAEDCCTLFYHTLFFSVKFSVTQNASALKSFEISERNSCFSPRTLKNSTFRYESGSITVIHLLSELCKLLLRGSVILIETTGQRGFSDTE